MKKKLLEYIKYFVNRFEVYTEDYSEHQLNEIAEYLFRKYMELIPAYYTDSTVADILKEWEELGECLPKIYMN